MAAQIIAVTEVIDLLRKYAIKVEIAGKDESWLSPAAYADLKRELERLAADDQG